MSTSENSVFAQEKGSVMSNQVEKSAVSQAQDVEAMSFKEASIELERIVRSLESGDLELEASLENYSRGVELLKSLRQRLEHAEQKVQVLVDASSESLETSDTCAAPSVAYIDE